MPRLCSICSHAEREAINRAIVERETTNAVTRRFAVSADALLRHKNNHLGETLREVTRARQAVKATEAGRAAETCALVEVAAADEVREVRAGGSLIERLAEIAAVSRQIMNTALRDADPELALKAIARCEKQWELEAKLIGELKDSSVNISVGAGGADAMLLGKLIRWLDPYPAARLHVAECIQNEFGDWEVSGK